MKLWHIVAVLLAIPGIHVESCMVEEVPGAAFSTTGNYDINNMNPDVCKSMCKALNNPTVTKGVICT